jgi:membrane protein
VKGSVVSEKRSTEKANVAPEPDDPRKPDMPTEITAPSWRYIVRKTVREFSADQCMDLAAALTYYAVLSIFPAMLAIVSLLGVFGQGPQTIDTLLGMVEDLGPADAAETLRDPLEQLSGAEGAGLALVLGVAGAVWSASGYVGAFGRAMNRIYEVDEGRPFWKLRPASLLLTVGILILVAAVALMLVVSGPVATTIGETVGLGDTALTVWNVAKWPVLAAIVILVVALLYYATPNVRQPKFRWISIGAAVAILTWAVASVVFGFYVANFGSYNRTYGSLAGAIIFLLWLWITNLALLFGAELDAELERGRQLQAGIPAERTIQLPPRDTRKSAKTAEKEAEDIRRGKRLRESAGQTSDATRGG